MDGLLQEMAASHCIRGEHVYEGMTLLGTITAERIEKIKHTIFDDSDVIVATFPKTGTTVMQEIVYLVHTNGDFETSDKVSLTQRVPYVEMKTPEGSTLDKVLKMQPPRLLKSHLPAKYFMETLNKGKSKFVLVMRNPKDTLVSLYYFYKANENLNFFTGTWDEFFTLFQNNRLIYGCYFDHVVSWWELRHHPNVLVVKYEDLLAKPYEIIRQVAFHLDKDISDELVSKIVQRTAFKNMKNVSTLNYSQYSTINQEISPFMRKGMVGDWKNHFNEEQSHIIEDLYKKRCVKEGLTFSFGEEVRL